MSVPSAPHDKARLRDFALSRRARICRLGASINLDVLPFAVRGKEIALYHAIGSELDPAPLATRLAEQGVQICLPVLVDHETMVFRTWDQFKPLVPAGFGTLGPSADQSEVIPDLILAPLAAFSSTGQRIGYGKGHYDRCLANMQAAGHFPAYVGLAYDEQEVPPFAAEPHDVPLDGVLTPSGLRVFDHGIAALAPFLR